MQELPTTPPPHPKGVTGSCEVNSTNHDHPFHVDLDEMTCDCKHGAAWRWDGKRWKPASLCSHKLKAIASLVSHNPNDRELVQFYEESIGKRFNAFEAVSAMHKEIRRGDTKAALYWATVMIPHRGRHGVVNYMRNILFEETRDLPLARYILRISGKGRSVSHLEMQRAVRRFCAAPKKWELPWRHQIFLKEMAGYKALAETYGYDVAKGKDIIPEKEIPTLMGLLQEGFTDADLKKLQMGLKGWFKSQSPDHDEMKIDILNFLIEVMNGERPNGFRFNEDYAYDLYVLLMKRLNAHGGVGYHELNAFADALSGENGYGPLCTLSTPKHKAIINYRAELRMPLGSIKRIPLYAADNHTWAGKAKMRAYPAQIQPGAKQTDLDLRYWGAYGGVAWRTLAYAQHATIDCKWEDVSWGKPKWLWGHVEKMVY